jgi:hypothetical protein
MNDQASAQSRASGQHPLVSFLLLFILLLALYGLSVGPVMKLCLGKPPRAVILFYTPLIALGDHSKPVNDFFHWYIVTVWKAW